MFEIPDTIKKSKAFESLRTEAAREVLRVLIQKNTFPELQKGISLSYAEAETLGISKDRFTLALDQLIEVGLIDISERKRQIANRFPKTLYALSTRYKYYGKKYFRHRKRQKRKLAPKSPGNIVEEERSKNAVIEPLVDMKETQMTREDILEQWVDQLYKDLCLEAFEENLRSQNLPMY